MQYLQVYTFKASFENNNILGYDILSITVTVYPFNLDDRTYLMLCIRIMILLVRLQYSTSKQIRLIEVLGHPRRLGSCIFLACLYPCVTDF